MPRYHPGMIKVLVTTLLLWPGDTPPQQANGIKIGEVDTTTALVWVRATLRADRNPGGPEFEVGPRPDAPQLPQEARLEDMRHAVPGAAGELRLVWGPPTGERVATPWVAVSAETDFTHVFGLQDLAPGTAYLLTSEARAEQGKAVTSRVEGGFRTAPPPDATGPVTFVVSTCQDFPRRDDPQRGHRIYPAMRELDPDFFVHLGDIVYYDKAAPFANTIPLARHKWNRMYALEHQREFHREVPAYFLKDDHDVLRNDCWPGQTYGELTWDEGLRLLREQLPVPRADRAPYRTRRWGKNLQVWLLEGREFRSPNKMEDGPGKTILGAAQRAWLERSLRASDAELKIVLSATPFVGPDRKSKNDNHANAGFTHEGSAVRKMLAEQGAVLISGDRHWQYVSRDPQTGLLELGCGPASDAHAGGYPSKPSFTPDFVRVRGGFLSVRIEGKEAVLRHHDVEGAEVHRVSWTGDR